MSTLLSACRGITPKGAVGVPTLEGVDGGPTIWVRPAGVTDASGAVGSWDSEGSNTLRFSNSTTTERPSIVTVGGLNVPQFDGTDDHLLSETTFTPIERYCMAVLLRIDALANNNRIMDTGSAGGGYLAFFNDGVDDVFRYEQGASDLTGDTNVADGEWHSVILDIQTSGGTSTLYLNNVVDGTLAGTAVAPTAGTLALAATSAGANAAGITLADLALWNDIAGAPSVTDIYNYHVAVANVLGVTLG